MGGPGAWTSPSVTASSSTSSPANASGSRPLPPNIPLRPTQPTGDGPPAVPSSFSLSAFLCAFAPLRRPLPPHAVTHRPRRGRPRDQPRLHVEPHRHYLPMHPRPGHLHLVAARLQLRRHRRRDPVLRRQDPGPLVPRVETVP